MYCLFAIVLCWELRNHRPCLNIKTLFPRYGVPMLKIRGSRDRLIFNTGIPILVRQHLYIFILRQPTESCCPIYVFFALNIKSGYFKVQYNTRFHTSQQTQRLKICPTLNQETIPHISPSWSSYGASFVGDVGKHYQEILKYIVSTFPNFDSRRYL